MISVMTKIAETLAENLGRLMDYHGIATDGQLAKLSHVDQKSLWRIRHCEQSPTVGKLEQIAQAFHLQAWQLLVPQLDPANPPVYAITDAERQLYKRLNGLARELIAREPKPDD